ncbi:MAG: hypothetical protein PF542_03165 [Nanoarchaeota archaeon]|jgi:hypothetical protein|nr:hypothetical protein [Nanoarchaeota archaeon]
MTRTKELLHELKHHLPFTVLATIVGIGAVLLIQFLFKITVTAQAFDILHPLHILASGIVSAGIFYRYKKNVIQAIFVGMFSALAIGTISDIIFPYLGSAALQLHPYFHFSIIEKPFLILGSALVGSIIGITTKTTKIPHTLHVGLSVFASLFYILAFTTGLTILHFVLSIIIILIAVVIPCCLSDILLPFFFLGKKIKHCHCETGHC